MGEKPPTPTDAEKAREAERARRKREREPISPRAWISQRSRKRRSIAGDLMEREF